MDESSTLCSFTLSQLLNLVSFITGSNREGRSLIDLLACILCNMSSALTGHRGVHMPSWQGRLQLRAAASVAEILQTRLKPYVDLLV